MNDWDESEHPRNPETGEFVDKNGGWVTAAAGRIAGFNQGRMSHAEVASYVGRTDYRTGPITQGDQSQTELRIYSDGRQLVLKRTYSDEAALGEVEYSLVARALGAPAPATVWDSEPDNDVLMEYIPGKTGWEHYLASRQNPDGTYRLMPGGSQAVEEQFAATDAGIMVGLVDVLGSHADRHPGNWIVDSRGIPVAIDNSDAFDPDGYRGPGNPPYARSVFSRHFTAPDAEGRLHYVDNPLHPDDIPAIRRRLEKLYRSSGGLSMLSHEGVMQTLDDLAAHATGTRRLVP